MPDINNTDKVAILLCTYNGKEYLKEQLDSIIAQSYDNWCLFVSDDGSNDSTLDILKAYQQKIGFDKIVINQGPMKGFAANFMDLIRKTPDSFDYYAFSDQDDIWLEDKLFTAVSTLNSNSNPARQKVYCGRTTLVDEHNNLIGDSPLFRKKPSLKNALVQSIAGGNTMVLNKEAFNIVQKTPVACDIVSHDWWIYILISAVGGLIIYDAKSTIRYRQHTGNLVGSNTGWIARCIRLKGLLKGKLKNWNQKNINSLLTMESYITDENIAILNAFISGRNSGLFKRSFTLMRLKLYRQTLVGSVALMFAIVLNKL